MELASLSSPSPFCRLCPCHKHARFFAGSSPNLLCAYRGLHIGIGCSSYKHAILRTARNSAQSSLLGIPTKHSNIPWQCFNPKEEFCGPHYSYQLHVQKIFARDIVVRSELAATGPSGDGYSLSGLCGTMLLANPSHSLLMKPNPLSALGSLHSLQHSSSKIRLPLTIRIPPQKFCQNALAIRNEVPQNADFPRQYSRKEKKPFPIPIVELRRAARERLKKRKDGPRKPLPPPKNGLLVKSLIPTAYNVYNARITLINNLKKLLKVVPVHACGWCSEIHVGPVGHPFKSCNGSHANIRKSLHEWTNAFVEDILIPIEAYHLFDRLGKRIPHEERFSIPRIPAVVELCIQAGVEIQEFPTKRRRKPIIRIGRKEFVDADESELPDKIPEGPVTPLLAEVPDSEIEAPTNKEAAVFLAEETLEAWERMRKGTKRLMRMYPVRVCGYCPEIHVGPQGHKAQNCGAHKHQQRNGQHGWQASVLDDLIPPRYVWHVPDVNGPPLQRELRNFYGKAPAVVEICIQAGAALPEEYKPTMRLDVGIPSTIKEAEMVV